MTRHLRVFAAYAPVEIRVAPSRADGAGGICARIVDAAVATAFEGYRWSAPAAAGLALVALGNVLVLATSPRGAGTRSGPPPSASRR